VEWRAGQYRLCDRRATRELVEVKAAAAERVVAMVKRFIVDKVNLTIEMYVRI
jgi:hypothetical protein